MSEENLKSVESQLSEIPAAQVKKPAIPVDAFCHQAERVLEAAKRDKEALVATGIDAGFIDTLPTRLGALRTADAEWQVRRRRGRPEDQVKREAAGFATRNDGVAMARFALRADTESLGVLDEIQKGDGLADMLDDMERLAVLYREKGASFAIPGFDAVKEAARFESDAAAIRAGSAAWRVEEAHDSGRERRDRAYTFAAGAIDEIRAAARFAFRKETDDRRIAPYVDSYMAAANRRRSAGRGTGAATTGGAGAATAPAANATGAAQSTTGGGGNR